MFQNTKNNCAVKGYPTKNLTRRIWFVMSFLSSTEFQIMTIFLSLNQGLYSWSTVILLIKHWLSNCFYIERAAFSRLSGWKDNEAAQQSVDSFSFPNINFTLGLPLCDFCTQADWLDWFVRENRRGAVQSALLSMCAVVASTYLHESTHLKGKDTTK